MGRLNTKRLMKQCKAIAAQQKAAVAASTYIPEPEPEPTVTEIKERETMTPHELEQYLTEFLGCVRDAKAQFERATAAEAQPNEAIQDILHAAELAPSILSNLDLITVLTDLRRQRRTTKQELEVTQIFADWAEEHKAAFNKLENVLGQMRKVLRRQPNDMYRFRTSVVGQKDSYLQAEVEKEETIDEDS